MAGILGIPPKYAHDLISCAIARKPRFPQGEKKKCSGVSTDQKALSLGFLASDGRLYHSKEKALRVSRDAAKREDVIRTLQQRENARLDRLKKAAKSGDIAFTKDGVFETKPCPSCDVYHKVPYVCSGDEPCPNSYLAKHPLKYPVKLQRFSGEDLDKKLPPVVHVGAQTSNTACKQPGSHACVQTSFKQLPEVSTQTSGKGFLPELAPAVRRPSCIKPPSSQPPPPEKRRKLRFKLVPQVQEVYLSECSSCDSSSCDSNASDQLELEKEKEKDDAYFVHLENLEKEENALSENLEKQKKRYQLTKEKVRRLTIDKAREEIQDKKELGAVQHEFAEKLKRKLALQAMLNTLNKEHGKMQLAIEKEKAARRVEEEKRKLDELLAEQLRLHVESKKSQFIKEKVDRDMAQESFKLPGQTEALKPTSSQLPRLSSFNIGKMAQSAKENYSRKEAVASPAVMMEILDSLPDETASQSSVSLIDDEESQSSLAARNELKMDMKKTLVILDGITRNVATMMGYSLPPMKPVKVTKSKVEKLPPITNQYLTAVPIEWSKEKLSSDEGTSKKLEIDEVKADESLPKKLVTEGVMADENKPKKLKADEVKADVVEVATGKCTKCGRDETISTVAAEKATKKAKIQVKIAELEQAMQVEMEKLQQIDEEPEEAVPADDIDVERIEKITEYEQIIEAAKERKITEVERAMKEREEARIADLERAKQAEKEAELAKEKAARMAECDHIINAGIEYRIAMVENAKRERDAARYAELERIWKEEEEASKKAAELEKAKQAEKEKEAEAAELEKAKQAEKEKEAEQAKEKQAQLAEYDRIINAGTDYRIAMVEQAKRERDAARLAELEQTKKAEEEASKVSDEVGKTEESEKNQSRVVEGDQVAEEVEEDISDRDDNEIELQKSYVQPTRSRPRPPTPPAGHPRMYHSHASLFGAQASLRTINESGTSDFTPEFASPLITHSMHAVVPFRSIRTRLGLRPHEAMTDKELGEEMRNLSEATLVLKREMMKRKHSRELESATATEATESVLANEAQKGVLCEETEIPEEVEESLQESDNGAKLAAIESEIFSEPPEPYFTMTAEEVMETDTLEEEEETVAELAITESEIFCEPPEPYFITTDSMSEEMMQMENFEPALVKSASVEFMKSGPSNESVASVAVQATSNEKEGTLMADISDQWSFKSEPSHQSLEDEYVQTLNQLATALCIDPEEVVKHVTPSPVEEAATAANVPPLESNSNASLEVEASDTSVKSTEEPPRLKKDSWTQTSNTSLMSTGTLRSYSTSSFRSVLSYTASIKNEVSDSEVESQLEEAEPEFSANGTSDDVPLTETPKKSSSKSSIRSKSSKTSLKSASGSTVSVKNETTQEEPQPSTGTPKSSSKSSVKSKASKASLKSDSASIVSVKNETFPVETESQPDDQGEPEPPVANVDGVVETPKKSSSKSSVKSKTSKASLKSEAASGSIVSESSPEPAQADGTSGESASTGTPKKSSSKSSIRSKSSKTSLKSVSGTQVFVKNETSPEAVSQSEQSAIESQVVTKDASTATPKSSSKSSVRSKSSKTSLKSISGSRVSVKNETTTDSEPEQCETVPQATTKDASTATPKSSSKSSVKSKSSKASLRSASGSIVSVKNETSPDSESEQREIESQVATKDASTATPKSSSKSSVKSKSSKASLKSASGSIVSVKNKTSPDSESEQREIESQVATKDASTATPKSSSKSSVKSKSSKASLKSASGSIVSVKNETSPDSESEQREIESQVATKDASTGTPKSSSKSSVKSKSSKTSLKSVSGSRVSVKNETTPELESQSGQNEPDAKVTDDVVQPPKSSSKTSVKAKSSKTSLKSASGVQVPVKNETSPEVVSQSEQSAIESQVATKDASTATPKSSSKSSVKSKSSKTSLKSISGSRVSVKNETTPEPEQCETVPQVATKDASTETLKKSFSKSSVRSKSSKTSLKSAPGAQVSVKNETNSSPEAGSQPGQPELNLETASISGQSASSGTRKSSSKISVRSKASKTSLKSTSDSKASVKNEASPEIGSQPEQCETESRAANKIISTPKSSSKSSVKSKSSKTSLKSISGSKVSVKNETTPEPEQCETVPQVATKDASTATPKSSSKSSVKSKSSKTSLKSASGAQVSAKNETSPEVAAQSEQIETESQVTNSKDAPTGTPKSSSKSSVKSKSSKTSLKSISSSRVSIKNETTPEVIPQPAQQAAKTGSRISVKNETPVKSQVIESQAASASANDAASSGTPKSSSKSSVKSKSSKTSLKLQVSAKNETSPEVESQSKQQDVIEPQAATKDASTGTPKSSSKSSVKSKSSKTSLLSISGSKISAKNETYAEVVSKPEQNETEPKVASSRSALKTSTASLRAFMKAVSDISPKGSQVLTPVIGKSISKPLATSPKTSATKLESSRSPSTASVKLIKSPTGSTKSLKSLRSSMKSLLLPSMGSKTAVNAAKGQSTDDSLSLKVEPNKSYASVVSSGSQSNVTAGQ